MRRFPVRCAQQHIGDAATFRAGQPCRDERIAGIDFPIDPQRATGQEHADDRDAGGLEFLQQRQVTALPAAILQVWQVALELGIRVFAEHDDRNVGLFRIHAVDREFGLATGGDDLRLDPVPDRFRIREVLGFRARALPRQCPAAGLRRNTVGGGAGNEDALARIKRQQLALVLEQHQRLSHRLTRDRAMRGAADQFELAAERALRRRHAVEQAEPQLDAQDARHGIVEPRHRDLARLHLPNRTVVVAAPTFRRHQHVDAGVERRRTILVRAAGDLAVRVPVTDDEAAEVHPALEHVGQQVMVAVHLHAVPRRERRHHALHAGMDRERVRRAMHGAQLLFADARVTLVLAFERAAVAEEVLGRRHHVGFVEELLAADLALQAFDDRRGIAGDDARGFGITFVGPAPAIIARHGQGRRKRPFGARRAELFGGRACDAADQRRIARCTEADVVREQRRTDDIVVAVHGVDAEQDRYRRVAAGRVHRCGVERVGHRQPFGRRCEFVAVRTGIAAGEDRAEPILAHVVRRDAADIGLDDLPDFFLDREFAEDGLDAALKRGIAFQRPSGCRPLLRMHGRIGRRRRAGLRSRDARG